MSIIETDHYIYIPEDYFGDGALAYRIIKSSATEQEIKDLKLFPFHECVRIIGTIRIEEITETMNKNSLFDRNRETFLGSRKQIEEFRNMIKALLNEVTS